MKKVKIMLLSLLVAGTVGGALAFKAKTYSPALLCGTTETCCSVEQPTPYTIINVIDPIPNLYCTTPGGDVKVCRTVTFE